MTTIALRQTRIPFWLGVGAAVLAWLVASFAAAPLAAWFAFDLLGLEPGTHIGEAVAFFAYDVPKVLLLLLGIVTIVTLIRGFFPPEKVRGTLAGRGEGTDAEPSSASVPSSTGSEQDRLLGRVVDLRLGAPAHDHLRAGRPPDRGLVPRPAERDLHAGLADDPARLVAHS